MCLTTRHPVIDKQYITAEFFPAITKIFKQNISSDRQACEPNLKVVSVAQRSIVILIETTDRHKYVFRARLDSSLHALFNSAYRLLKSRQRDTNLMVYALDMSCQKFPYPYVITSFVEGQVKAKWHEKTLILHAQTLARLHRKTYPSYRFYGGQASSKMCIKQLFEGCIYYWRKTQPILFSEQFVNKTADYLSYELDAYQSAFRAKSEFSMVHGDAHNQNIIIHKGTPNLIDWESAYTSDGAIDFATLFWPFPTAWQHHISDSVKEEVQSEYLRFYPDPYFAERVEAWTLFTMFFWYLDHSLYCTRPRSNNDTVYHNRMFAKNSIRHYFTEKCS